MNKIIKLDKNLANQIAAWEVVERPVSVIKELIENSIDSGADMIQIEIKEGWTESIIITDNWDGIYKEDLPLVIEKYSTSKIKNIQDLYNIMTFWFRWEALSSISSVSKFQIISKTRDCTFGYKLETDGGENISISQYASENGTKIIINNLFFNTPARLNYLKKPRTEYSKILDFINKMSLSYPNICFEFESDNKKILKFAKNESLKTRIYAIYWEDFSDNLIEINHQSTGIHISWYISSPKVSFPTKNRQSLFINKRVVSSPLVYKAIYDAYNRYIPHGMNGAYVLNLDVDPTQIDVNVHPRKMEVRFASEQNIFRNIYHAVEDALKNVSLIQTSREGFEHTTTQDNTHNNTTPSYYTGSWTKFKSYSPYKDTSPNPNQGNISDAMNFSKNILSDNWAELIRPVFEKSNDLHDTALGKIIGQMHNSYILVQTQTGLKILDQHALAERIIYERLVHNQYKAKTQWLLIGESISFSPKQWDILEENAKVFEKMWFDYEKLSNWLIMVNGIPDFIKKDDIKSIFEGIITDIWEENFNKSNTLEEVRNKIFAYASCRSAIKFWHKLNLFEMNKLLNDSVLDYSMTCPHGRPVVYDIDLNELKNKYER